MPVRTVFPRFYTSPYFTPFLGSLYHYTTLGVYSTCCVGRRGWRLWTADPFCETDVLVDCLHDIDCFTDFCCDADLIVDPCCKTFSEVTSILTVVLLL
jgi:hypothetical protein